MSLVWRSYSLERQKIWTERWKLEQQVLSHTTAPIGSLISVEIQIQLTSKGRQVRESNEKFKSEILRAWDMTVTFVKFTMPYPNPQRNTSGTKLNLYLQIIWKLVGSDRQGGWGVEWRDDRIEKGGAEDEVMCLQKALQPGVRSCSWKPSGKLDLSRTKHTGYIILLSISFSPLPPSLQTPLLPIFSPPSSHLNIHLLSNTLSFLLHWIFSSFSLSQKYPTH